MELTDSFPDCFLPGTSRDSHSTIPANLPPLSLSCVSIVHSAPRQDTFTVLFVSASEFTIAKTPLFHLLETMSDCTVRSLGKAGHGICEEPLGEMKPQPDCVEREPECQRILSKSACS